MQENALGGENHRIGVEAGKNVISLLMTGQNGGNIGVKLWETVWIKAG